MTCKIAYRLFMFLCGTMLLTTSCSDSDNPDTTTGADQIKSLADLKALFDKGEVTHIDFITKKLRVLLDEEIESMEIIPNDDIFGFELIEIVTMSPGLSADTPDNLRQHNTTSLTFADKIVNSDLPTTYWAQTITKIHRVEVEDFKPYAYLIDSEITTAGLSLLEDKLQMEFKKK